MQTDYADVAATDNAILTSDEASFIADCAVVGTATQTFLSAPSGATATQAADLAVVSVDILTFHNACLQGVNDFQTSNATDAPLAGANMSQDTEKLTTDINSVYASTGSTTTVG